MKTEQMTLCTTGGGVYSLLFVQYAQCGDMEVASPN